MSAPDHLFTKKMPAVRIGQVDKEVLFTSSSEPSAVLKERFYLDKFVAVEDKAGNSWWAGACYVGSENYYMHNTARHGWIRCKEQSTGREYVVFWDAGLNTLGKTLTIPVVTDTSINNFTAKSTQKSAYYVDGFARMQYRTWNSTTNSWGLWYEMGGMNPMSENTQEEKSSTITFDRISPEMRAHGIAIRAYHENAEGNYFGSESTAFYATGARINFTNTGITYYMNTGDIQDVSTSGDYATELFTDPQLINKYEPSGVVDLYLEDTTTYKKWVVYGYSALLDYVCVLEVKEWRDTGPEPNPRPETYIYNGYDSSVQEFAENQAMSGGMEREIYFNTASGTAHKSYSGTDPDWIYGALANEGYYARGNASGVSEVYYIDGDGFYHYTSPIN